MCYWLILVWEVVVLAVIEGSDVLLKTGFKQGYDKLQFRVSHCGYLLVVIHYMPMCLHLH